MTTQLALGVVGAAVGYFTGGVGYVGLGFMAGSLVGSLVDPQKIEGPRITDHKLQVSEYGKMIPYVWGCGRIAGNVIDQTDLQEHSHKSSGKGGPETENFTYTASLDILICAAPVFDTQAILGCTDLWANGRLIWSDTSGDPMPFTLYLGTEDQLPDPTFEAVHGVGEVSAYRGWAHAVFTDYDMTEFGRVAPQFEFRVFTAAGTFPWRVSTFDAIVDNPAQPLHGVTYDHGTITIGQYRSADHYYYDRQFLVDGTGVGSPYSTGVGTIDGRVLNLQVGVVDDGVVRFYVKDQPGAVVVGNPMGGSTVDFSGAFIRGVYFEGNSGYLYALGVGTYTGITRWYAPGGVPNGTFDVAYPFGLAGSFPVSGYKLGTSNDAFIYVIHRTSPMVFYKFDTLLNLVLSYTMPVGLDTDTDFYIYGDILAMNTATSPTDHFLSAYYINGGAFDFIGDVAKVSGPIIGLGGGLVISADGVFSLIPPPAPVKLYTIVGDLSDMTPAAGAYDVSTLIDDVRWFVVASQGAVRNFLEPLRQCFFFDAVESDDVVKFVKRGGGSLPAIPDGDLCARPYGEEPGDPLKTTRNKEQGLPLTVTMKYIDVDADYQTGTQSSPRQVTLSQNNVTIEVPIGLTATEAAQKCWTIQCAEWMEREAFEWSTSRKWEHYEPCDITTVRGRVIRIRQQNKTPIGVIKFEGVLAEPSLYTQVAPGAPGGFVPQLPPGTLRDTQMLLLDIPMLADGDFERGIRIAMGPAQDGRWPGASAYKSSDAGTTYTAIATAVVPDVIGSCTTALPDWLGGNTFDESSVLDVALTDDDATLTNYSADAVLNGSGYYVVGLEIVQAKNAALTGTKAGQLSGFLRGRRGTEWAMTGHVAGERFVALPVVDVDMTAGELFQSRLYKGVTLGKTLASATAQTFANMGQAARPYSPELVGGGSDASGNLTFNWARRTRIGGEWKDFAASPLGELTEAYVVQIWNTARTTVARIITGITSPTTSYSAANQTTDFGAVQQTITFSVGQVGSYQLGTQTFYVCPSTGGSNNEPIVSTPPYNGPPTPGAGGGAANVTLTYPSQNYHTSGVLIGDTFIAKFTVGGTPPTGGYISVAEFSGTPYTRHIRLCTDVAGTALVANGERWGNPASLSFGAGAFDCALSASTDYYLIIKMELANGSPSGPLGTPADVAITLLAT